MCSENLTRSSLGRLAFIGELYDIRNESLKSMSLFSNINSIPKFVRCIDVAHTAFDYSFTENISDRFDLLKVEPELQLNVLLGLIKIEGSGKFLSEEKKSGKTISCSVMCQIRTVHEKFYGSPEEILPFVDMKVLRDPQYTHMVSEIIWGTNCLMTVKYDNTTNSNRTEIQGRLEASLAKLKVLTIKGGGQLDKNESSFFNSSNVKIKINADVVPEDGCPTTVDEFCRFVANVPKLLNKINGGKGKPLAYVVMPLAGIRKLCQLECAIDNFISVKVDEGFLNATIFLFEEIVEVKQKLHDLLTEMKNHRKYVSESNLKVTAKTIENLSVQESTLKTIMSEEWIQVRRGKKTLRDMIRRVEKFKNSELKLLSYTEYLESCDPVIGKLSTIKNYISEGVLYLGKGETFRNVQAKNLNQEFIVLFTSSELEKADPDLSAKSSYYFLSLACEPQPETKYVVVDLDLTDEKKFFNIEIAKVRCFHIKGGKVINSDLLATWVAEAEMNFARPTEKGLVNLTDSKPGERTTLEMVCPGFSTGTCSSTALEWTCFACKTTIEYDFNQYFYCRCGKCLATSFEYRCRSFMHGDTFIPADPEFLKERLSKLNPLQELNILFLGQSGVGKSTFINSIVNYLTYDTINMAKERGVICTIPISVTMYDPKKLTKHVVKLGGDSDNEVTAVGDSSTQFPHTYTFIWKKKCIRIIDSPGLGDVRGIEMDKINLRNIIDHLAYFKSLHGVCVLLKANDNKFNVIFKYCIKELLANLHKSVLQNIVFCFTNSRTSLYSPGQASAVLERVLAGIGHHIPLGKHNMFSYDNEAFLFLCSLQCPEIEHPEVVQSSFAESWRISLEETRRLFETIESFKPHFLKETVTLVTSRSRVLSLTKPLAEVCKTIQQNIAVLESKQKEIEESDLTLSELEKKLHVSEIYLETEVLNRPRTVCTSSSCVEYHTYEGTDIREIEYICHCHQVCYVEKVTPKTVNNVLLKTCEAMNQKTGKCYRCGCGWEMHMHITYAQKRVSRTIVNKKIKAIIEREKSERDEKNEFVSSVKSIVNKYKEEESAIIQASVKFGTFLKQNAIAVYNDSVLEYLEYLIDEEKHKPKKSKTEKRILKNLQDTLDHYKTEMRVIEEVLQKGKEEAKLSMEDMKDLEEGLYKLELTGESIKKSVQASRTGNEKMMMYSETPIYFTRSTTSRRKLRVRLLLVVNSGRPLCTPYRPDPDGWWA